MTGNEPCNLCGDDEYGSHLQFREVKKDQPPNTTPYYTGVEMETAFTICRRCFQEAMLHIARLRQASDTTCKHEKAGTLVMGKPICRKCGDYLA